MIKLAVKNSEAYAKTYMGLVGFGRVGLGLAEHLVRTGFEVIARS